MAPLHKKTILILLVFFSVSLKFPAQKEIDSLEAILKGKYHDTIKMSALSNLVQIHWKKDLRKAGTYAKTNLVYALKSGNNERVASAYNLMAGTYFFLGDYENSLLYNIRTLNERQKKRPDGSTVGTKKGIASSYLNIAGLYLNLGNYPKAIENNLNALRLKEEIKDSVGVARVLSNIGNVYETINDFEKAIEFHNRSIEISKRIKEDYITAACYNNLGNVYVKKENFAKARDCYEKAIELRIQIGDEDGLYGTYNNIGELFFQTKDYVNARKYYELAWDYYSKSADPYIRTSILANMAQVYRHFNETEKAESYFKRAAQVAQKNKLPNIEKNVYESMAQMYKEQKNFEKAYQYMYSYSRLVDTIFKVENSKKTAELQVKYDDVYKTSQIESMKKEKMRSELEGSLKELEIQKQKSFRNVSLVALAMMLIIGFLFYNRYSIKNKLNLKLEYQNHQIAEKNKDITNSINYAKRIQDAIIPSSKIVSAVFPDNFILYKPKDIVAGDFYWCETLGNLKFIAVADCTGHGVPGALVSVVCSNALNRALMEFNITEPGKLLDKTRELVYETFKKSDEEVNDGMDISLMCINGKNASWAGANNSLVYFSKNSLHEIKAHKQPIGKSLINTPFPTHHINLCDGDIFYLFTDGYADQFGGAKGKKLKYKNMLGLFAKAAGAPLNEQKQQLNAYFEEWRAGVEQLDDVCIIGIKI